MRNYWHLKAQAPNCSLWRAVFGKDYGPVGRQLDDDDDDDDDDDVLLNTEFRGKACRSSCKLCVILVTAALRLDVVDNLSPF
jgi:hypothetical protein